MGYCVVLIIDSLPQIQIQRMSGLKKAPPLDGEGLSRDRIAFIERAGLVTCTTAGRLAMLIRVRRDVFVEHGNCASPVGVAAPSQPE